MLRGGTRARRSLAAACSLGLTLLLAPLAARAAVQDPPAAKPDLTREERADIYMARKMYREAVETYSEIEPLTAAVLNKIGIAYQQQSDIEQARKYYGRAVKMNPKYAEAINNLGTVYYAQKSYRRATSLYKRALVLQPLSATMHVNLGAAWFARHNYEEAARMNEKALELDPEVFERHGSQGVLLEERDITERAKFNYFLARAYAKRGNNELALQYIRKALETGFKDRKKFLEDEEFAALRKLPEFDELMKLQPKVL